MHQSHDADDKRSHFNANFCSRDPFYGCLPWEKGVLNAPAMATGSIDGLFGVIAQTNNFNDEYANTIAAPTIDQINRDFDPHTKQTFEFSQLTLVKQFDNYELKINASRGDRDYTRTGDVDGSTASEGLTSGAMQAILKMGAVAAYGSEAAYGAAIVAGTADPYTNASPGGQFSMLLDLPCLDAPHNFTGDGSYECSRAPSVVDQIDINLVSDLDGPFNFVLGAFAWESDGKNKFYTHTAAYNVMRSFDLHPVSEFFDGTNPALPVLAGQGYGGLGFYSSFMAEYFAGFAGVYNCEDMPAEALVAGCSALMPLDDGTYSDYLDVVNALAPTAYKRTLPIEIGGLVQDNPVIQQTLSLYGNFFYDITDDTKLTLGYRYNEDSYEDTTFNTLGDGLNPNYVYSPTYDLATVGATYTEGEDSNSTYKIAIQHNLNDNAMVYASMSTGNKPGGATPDQYGTPTVFAPETVDAFELGLRSILMDGALLMNLTAFNYDFKDAHYSQVVGSAAITNSIDYTHTGLEGQMKLFLSPSTSVDFNFLALDSTIGAGEYLFNPLNPNGASEILDYYNLMRPADVARLAAALDAAVAAGTISVDDITEENPFFNAATIVNGACVYDPATDPRAIACAPTLGGNGADYLAVLTGNPAAGSLLPFALFANTDKGFIATFQGFNLTETRFLNTVGIPMRWLASEYEVDLEGKRTPFTSELDWNMALNHSMPLMNGTLDLKLTFTHKGDSNGDLFESMNTYVPEAEYIDIYGNWTPASGDYNVGFYVKNLDDERQLGAARTTSELVGGPVNVYYTQPRTAGVTFTYNF